MKLSLYVRGSRVVSECLIKVGKLSFLHGPRNDPNLNGTRGALLVAGCFNSDVQLPYRLLLTRETHSALCSFDDT